MHIDAENGLLPSESTTKKNMIFEAFRAGTEPITSYGVIDPEIGNEKNGQINNLGDSGIY